MARSLATSSKIIGCLGLVCVGTIGCRDAANIAPARGRVTVDGHPLTASRVEFAPIAQDSSNKFPGRPAYGRTDDDGRFVLGTNTSDDGAVVGPHRVSLFGGKPPAEFQTGFPEFALLRMVGMKFEVVPGKENEFEINLDRDFVRKYGEEDD